ncbi:NUDIX domain protein, partial [Vibrio parahaemolyticus V-223/04]
VNLRHLNIAIRLNGQKL